MRKSWLVVLGVVMGLAMAQGKLTVWTHYSGPELEWLKKTAASFEKSSGTKVEVVEVPFGDIQNKFILGAPQGQAADLIVSIPHDWVGAMAAAGVLEPMGKYATASYVKGLDDVAVEALTYRNQLFALPMFAESVALIYNKKFVKSAPKTWDEFLKLAQENTKGNTFGFLYNIGDPYFNYGFFTAYGASVFAKRGGSLNVGDLRLGGEAGQKALNFIKDLRYKYKLVPEGVDYGVADGAFKDGSLAMIINGPWAIGDYKKAKIDFGIASFPAPPGGSAWKPFVGVQGVAMNAYSRNKTAAANFAKLLVSENSQIAFNQAGGRIPVSKAAVAKLKNDPVVAGFSPVIASGTPMPNIPEMGKVWGPWGNAISQAIQKPDTNVTKIIEDMVAEIRKGIGSK
ncbi:maltose ABC transporter substrate-binding protein [Calidithermus timidus]|jgi:arabinogalactan oligomer/maltooligosaccharide transport system substrate-binding protein|uniref:sugar ABC transporter substrate-binding protein n=1 Tax=Calidithermus timidus TaxID=307124 RepID=UPI00039E8FF8|nr:maltose ABC transporter substrate-binding protein [Calidithermus timidus]